MTRIEQISLEQWPQGVSLAVAVIELEPKEIETRFGLKFFGTHDDLDYFQACIFTIDGIPFALQRYSRAPKSGTNVLINEAGADKKSLLDKFLNAFKLAPNELSWIHPEAGGNIRRSFVDLVLRRFSEPSPRIQMLFGPRQVGKTTGAKQVLQSWAGPTIYAAADGIKHVEWLREQWQLAIHKGQNCLLALDEFQKVDGWQEVIKELWDRTGKENGLRVLLLGSNSLMMGIPSFSNQRAESLAGRFETTYVPHWSYQEFKKAFGFDLNRYLLFGGYPGSAPYVDDFPRWLSYVNESILIPVMSIDIPQSRVVKKKSAFFNMFSELCRNAGREVSYTQLLHSIQDGGNTDIVKDYMSLYEGVFLFKRLTKYSERVRTRESSPKILPRSTALPTCIQRSDTFLDEAHRERMFEITVGLELMRTVDRLYHWHEGSAQVDYVVRHGNLVYAVNVKGTGDHLKAKGMKLFLKKFPKAKPVIISEQLFESFSRDPLEYLKKA